MGHRANYICRTADGLELYYSHWGANVIHADLFWGPRSALDFCRSQRATSEWLDDVWCEGGAYLDMTAKRLVFFGGESIKYDPFLRAGLLAFFEHTWRGWNVEWAHRGILDLAAAAGVDQSLVIGRSPARADGDERDDKPRPVTRDKPWSETVLELDGRLFSLENPIESVLRAGPEFLRSLPSQDEPLVLDDTPVGGLRAQEGQKQIDYWHMSPFERPELDFEFRWPGWTLSRRHDLALDQSSRALRQAGLSVPTWTAVVEGLRSSVCRNVSSRALSLDGLRAWHGPEAKIELNPLATEDLRPQIDVDQAGQAFDRLASRVKAVM